MAFDAFLKIDGVDGESTRKGFEKQTEIFSYSFGASNPSTVGSGGGGGGGGKVS
ncbi:MAG: type VI secretion system tube protein Hcp, partial [Gemmatimonadales bacterium]